ncbi:MAG: hypothetical protein IPL41_15515 [Micropruina sp.]|nr:hypothetical protein [Micropruina sp.]
MTRQQVPNPTTCTDAENAQPPDGDGQRRAAAWYAAVRSMTGCPGIVARPPISLGN